MDIYVSGKKVRLDPAKSIGKGGEADIFDIGGGFAAKIFKEPDHPDYTGQPHEQQGARERIAIHQEKLPAFPKGLPERVVTPVELATDRLGKRIVGYTMPIVRNAEVLLRYADRGFRQGGVPTDTVVQIFRDLHQTVGGIHRGGVVIGDFNDLNVLVRGSEAFVIDADSFQFGRFPCRLYTAKFVDPLLCNPRASAPELVAPHSPTSDWYAFAVMLMECLLFVDPYGGVYRPKDQAKRVLHDARPLRRITVFHPEVRYPKPAVPYGVLPDDLLDYFHRVFERDERGVFPLRLIEAMRWTACSTCGTEHARAQCPNCQTAAPAAVREVVRVRGKVTATRIFRTSGVILTATVEDGMLRFLYHESGVWRREDRSEVARGALDPQVRYRIQGQTTLMGRGSELVSIARDGTPAMSSVDTYGLLPVFDANARAKYWAAGGQILRDGPVGPEYVGDVLAGQTLLWVGSDFGFGFYRAGNLSVAFVFPATGRGVNDTVKLPPIRGQLIDATAVFTRDRVWFFTSTNELGKSVNRCTVIRADGTVEAGAETTAGDGSWLGTIRGKCAAGNFLLAATDDGIVRVEPQGTTIAKTREFPDTEPFVDADSMLLADSAGIYVVDRQEIKILKIR